MFARENCIKWRRTSKVSMLQQHSKEQPISRCLIKFSFVIYRWMNAKNEFYCRTAVLLLKEHHNKLIAFTKKNKTNKNRTRFMSSEKNMEIFYLRDATDDEIKFRLRCAPVAFLLSFN